MLTISLDEYGDFEEIGQEHKPVYIAGLIYDDRGTGDTAIERKRICGYYRSAIRDAADCPDPDLCFQFPNALHSNGNEVRDHNVVRPVKQAINASLSEFLRFGTYQGSALSYTNSNGGQSSYPDRGGEYHLFVIIKSDAGMSRLLTESASIFAKDDYASNLYFHMANEAVSRLIFHNPIISDMTEINLDIATRSSGNLNRNDQRAQEYRKLGYTSNASTGGSDEIYFQLTNPDVYRTVIAEEILKSEKTSINITSFHVRSINYNCNAERALSMAFLYMADTICSVLGFDIAGNNADEWLRCIVNRAEEITGREDNLIFGYDEIDRLYSQAWNRYADGDYYKALSIVFDAQAKKGEFVSLYKRLWFRVIEKRILSSRNVSNFNMAVRKLKETLNNNSLNQEKAFYILGILDQMAPEIEKQFHTPEAAGILYTLYDIGVTACCHIGDSKNAERFFEKCTQLAGIVSLEDYLLTRNRLVVYCCDYFETKKAKELSDGNIEYQELLTELKKEVHLQDADDRGDKALGKAYSQRGQVYAFMRDDRAESDFQRAMEIFGSGSADYNITLSYLLHYYLDNGNKDAYFAKSVPYFGGKRNLSGQLNYIVKEGSKEDSLINPKFALYVFVRGIYLFRLSELTDETWKALQSIEARFTEKVRKYEWRLTGHPCELIFKYMTLIALSRGEEDAARLYAGRMESCLTYSGPTIDAINGFSKVEIAHLSGDIALRDRLSRELCTFLTEHFEAFKTDVVPEDGVERYLWLSSKLTFMYR